MEIAKQKQLHTLTTHCNARWRLDQIIVNHGNRQLQECKTTNYGELQI